MESYLVYHDCGKHISQYIDENGRRHFPNHAYHSSIIYNKYFDNSIAEDLILKDLNFHTFSSNEFENWIANESINNISSLFLSALAEILANSTMFGGIESTSFKIKRKKLIQFSKKLKPLFENF
jgi:CRISPR/Cas system-associated endonuclease Cas3-HD